jgi:hypothetical protein
MRKTVSTVMFAVLVLAISYTAVTQIKSFGDPPNKVDILQSQNNTKSPEQKFENVISSSQQVLSPNSANANFIFSQSTGTYTPITGGIVLDTGFSIDDNMYRHLPIGFNFGFDGGTYTNFCLNANGYITVADTIVNTYTPISTANVNVRVVSAQTFDMRGNYGAELRYETIGTAPNRTLVVQWTNFKAYSSSYTGNFNFQIQLLETSNIIKIVYGSYATTATSSAQVGLRGLTNTDFNNRTSTTSWSATTAGTLNTSSVTLSSTVLPSSGLNFIWTPFITPQQDAGLVSVLPASGSSYLTNTIIPIYAKVKNFGVASQTSIPVYYKVNNGTAVGPVNITGTLVQNDTQTVVFSGANAFTPATAGIYNIKVYTALPNDSNATNDTAYVSYTIYSPLTVPVYQNFDSVTAPALPVGWSIENTNGDANYWKTITGYANSAPNSMYISYNSSLAMNDWFFTPAINLPAGQYKISFVYKNSGTSFPEKLELKWGTAANSASMTLGRLFVDSNVASSTFLSAMAPVTVTTPGIYYFGWHGYSAANMYYISVDDISITTFPANDVGTKAVFAPTALPRYMSIPFIATISNFGSASQTFSNSTNLMNGATVVNSVTGSYSLASLKDSAFAGFLPHSNSLTGAYSIKNVTSLSGDANPANDSLRYLKPLILNDSVYSYDDGTLESNLGFNTASGYLGNMIYLPMEAPLTSVTVKWGIIPGTLAGNSIEIWDVVNGLPSALRTIVKDSITLTAADSTGMSTYVPASPITLPAGTYFIAVHQSVVLSGTYIVGCDNTGMNAVSFPKKQYLFSTTGTSWTDYYASSLFLINMIRPNFYAAPLAAPVLVYPANGQTSLSTNVGLRWNNVTNATSYRVLVYNDSAQTSVYKDTTIAVDSVHVIFPQSAHTYWWKAAGIGNFGQGAYSASWKFTVNPSGINPEGSNIPTVYNLYNNYPNPFNPSTTIKFDVPKNAFVKISIYDIAGREVKVLVNDNYMPGAYQVEFNAGTLASGIYFYKMKSDTYSQVKKMVLVK